MTDGQKSRLNSYVALCVDCSRDCPLTVLATRQATIDAARAYAASIDIPPDEIAGAVEAAIKIAEAAAS